MPPTAMQSPDTLTILLTDSDSVRRGLASMLTSAIGDHDYPLSYTDLPTALFIIEIAKRSEDRPEWFPRGKWATIQALQDRTERALARLFAPT